MIRSINFIAASLIIALLLSLASCSKDNNSDDDFLCPDVPCQFGEVTNTGNQTCSCNCNPGYEGDSCEISIAWTKYKGYYQVIDSCLGPNRYNYGLTIEATGNDNKVYIPAFREIYVPNPNYNDFNDFQPMGIVFGDSLSLPFQTFDDGKITIEGKGTLNGNTLTLQYTLLFRGVEETCTAIFNR